MTLKNRIIAFSELGRRLSEFTRFFYDDSNSEFQKILSQAHIANQWFTKENQAIALSSIAEMLDEIKLKTWLSKYSTPKPESGLSRFNRGNQKRIGAIMAGNIPAVGFHDLLCILITGNVLKAKCSSDDKILLPWISKLLIEIEPGFVDKILFVERMSEIDAVIATGSDNSARYFEYYFSKYSHIIRKNRNAVAVLSGKETEDDLKNLGKDIFTYFGLGCRNVSKLYVPSEYNFTDFFRVMESFSEIMQHNKYMNNYDYNHAVLLLNKEKFLTNNFMIVKEDKTISTPVSVLNYEFYKDVKSLKQELNEQTEKIQCIVCGMKEIVHQDSLGENTISFGKAQQPELENYADGVDTIQFLMSQ